MKSLVSKMCVATVTRLSPVPSATSAVMIGRPIATTEPKVSSSTTIAASSAMPSELELCWRSACWIAWPPSSTCRPGCCADCAVSITLVTAGFLSWNAR